MGNCLRSSSNKVLAEDIDEQESKMELAQTLAPKEFEHGRDAKKKNRVSFKLQEEEEDRHRHRDRDRDRDLCGTRRNSGNSRSGVVRIRMVVTQEELKQILDYKKSDSKFSSVEQLLREMRLRGRSVFQVEKNYGNCGINGSWSPALESIPEDH